MKPLEELRTEDKIITSRGDVYVVKVFCSNPLRFSLGCDHHFGSSTFRFWSEELWSVEHLKEIGAKTLDNELAP